MPDRRSHRGAHPEDTVLFAAENLPTLRAATGDLGWLLGRDYASISSLKLVGDRYELRARQRTAVARAACSEQARIGRAARLVCPDDLSAQVVDLDGYNVLTSMEAALGGGVILGSVDGCFRDMASMHGTYRRVAETAPAIRLIGDQLAAWGVGGCHWYLDRPVSNSGRLRHVLLDVAAEAGWPWTVELDYNPDRTLGQSPHIVATADSVILDTCGRWFNLTRTLIESRVEQAWIADLSLPR